MTRWSIDALNYSCSDFGLFDLFLGCSFSESWIYWFFDWRICWFFELLFFSFFHFFYGLIFACFLTDFSVTLFIYSFLLFLHLSLIYNSLNNSSMNLFFAYWCWRECFSMGSWYLTYCVAFERGKARGKKATRWYDFAFERPVKVKCWCTIVRVRMSNTVYQLGLSSKIFFSISPMQHPIIELCHGNWHNVPYTKVLSRC